MYNSKHLDTWDDNLHYVQHNYNKAIHNSIGHNPFQVCLGFQPLGPINVALPLESTQDESSHAKIEADKVTWFIEKIQHIHQQVHDILQKANAMINIGFHTNSKWATRFGCICRKRASQDPIGSLVHFSMGLIPSPRLWVC